MITHLLDQIAYEYFTQPPLDLPPRQPDEGYVPPPIAEFKRCAPRLPLSVTDR